MTEPNNKSPFAEAPGRFDKPSAVNLWFSHFAAKTAVLVGRPQMFFLAVAVILAWAILGPSFGFSDTWQLIINTGTTIITFLGGLLDSEHPEPRCQGSPPQIG